MGVSPVTSLSFNAWLRNSFSSGAGAATASTAVTRAATTARNGWNCLRELNIVHSPLGTVGSTRLLLVILAKFPLLCYTDSSWWIGLTGRTRTPAFLVRLENRTEAYFDFPPC